MAAGMDLLDITSEVAIIRGQSCTIDDVSITQSNSSKKRSADVSDTNELRYDDTGILGIQNPIIKKSRSSNGPSKTLSETTKNCLIMNMGKELIDQIELRNMKLLSESGSGVFECSVCGCTINGVRQADDHAIGAKHKKKLLQAGQKVPALAIQHVNRAAITVTPAYSSRLLAGNKLLTDDIRSEVKAIIEEIMNSSKNGKSHQSADVLNAMVSQPTIKRAQADMPNSEYIVPITTIHGNEFFCEACDAPLNGQGPIREHIAGKAHKKKVQARMITLVGRDLYQPPAVNRYDVPSELKSKTLEPILSPKLESNLENNPQLLSHQLSDEQNKSKEMVVVTANEPIPDLF